MRDIIPISHIENFSFVHNGANLDKEFAHARTTFDRSTPEVHLLQDLEKSLPREELLVIITHNIGHNVYENLVATHPKKICDWSVLYDLSYDIHNQTGLGFVTELARSNPLDDFAETYTAYIYDPERLKFFNPSKYEFMKDSVFAEAEDESRFCHPFLRMNLKSSIVDQIYFLL